MEDGRWICDPICVTQTRDNPRASQFAEGEQRE
jgi:hypothetical protein